MTETNPLKQQQSLRLGELANLARQRYLESGGDPYRSANGQEWLNEAERQEYLTLAREVFHQESINYYLKTHGTWKDKLALMKERFKFLSTDEHRGNL